MLYHVPSLSYRRFWDFKVSAQGYGTQCNHDRKNINPRIKEHFFSSANKRLRILKPHHEHLSSTGLLHLDMADLIPFPSAVFDQAGKGLSHKRFRWQSPSPQQHRVDTALVRVGGGCCTVLFSRGLVLIPAA